MEILVEIGNDEQQKIIADELKLIEKLLDLFKPPLNIKQVIIPCDFNKTVN